MLKLLCGWGDIMCDFINFFITLMPPDFSTIAKFYFVITKIHLKIISPWLIL